MMRPPALPETGVTVEKRPAEDEAALRQRNERFLRALNGGFCGHAHEERIVF